MAAVPFLLRQYRTKSVWRLCTPSACKFSVIFHKNAREYIKYSLRFLFHLTKNLTTHLSHNLCAVLPYLQKMSKFPIDKSTRILYNKNRAMLCKIPYTLSRVVEEQVL